MSTPLTDGINALTAYANETTGAEDVTLSDAVGRLCEGYGGEGSPINMAVSQINYQPDSNNAFTASNLLGEIPDVVMLLPIDPPTGTGTTNPYAICCYKDLTGAIVDMYNVVVEFKLSNGNWDYSRSGKGWLAVSEKIYFKSSSREGIYPQDYILIAYKYTT